MNELRTPSRDGLDDKVTRVFAGKVARKDLVRKVKVVNDTLAENYILPDEATKAQSLVKERGRHTFIDEIKVRITDSF